MKSGRSQGSFDLHYFYNQLEKSDKRTSWLPVDPEIYFPYHHQLSRVPCLFEPGNLFLDWFILVVINIVNLILKFKTKRTKTRQIKIIRRERSLIKNRLQLNQMQNCKCLKTNLYLTIQKTNNLLHSMCRQDVTS